MHINCIRIAYQYVSITSVRRGNSPGQFFFSVLDNGVVSNEFWRILDCAEVIVLIHASYTTIHLIVLMS